MNLKQSFPKIKTFLRQHERFLISIHANPDGDSLGAELALAHILRSLGKQCEIINADISPRAYTFLPGITSIRRTPRIKHFDAVIMLDCSDIARVSSVKRYLPPNAPILNIDHHISNTRFGTINYVDPDASSTCELLYFLFRALRLRFNKKVAHYLYTGIMTDTGSFRFASTTSRTHEAIADLMKWNINASDIYHRVYADLAISDLRLVTDALQQVQIDGRGRIAWTSISRDMFRAHPVCIDIADVVLTFMRLLRNVEVAVLFKEFVDQPRRIRVNLRSRGRIDVNRIARHFGGGGHKTASGLTLQRTSLSCAESKVIKYIKTKLPH